MTAIASSPSDISRGGSSPEGWVVWKLKKASPKVASARYRCLLPIFASAELYRTSLVIGGARRFALDGVRALVFVKTFYASDLAMAQQAADRGIPIYFDLCDNIFVDGYGGAGGDALRERFTGIAALATAIVSNGPGLSRVLREHLPEAWHHKLVEQPDPIETRDLVARLLFPRQWPNREVAARLAGATSPAAVVKTVIRERGYELKAFAQGLRRRLDRLLDYRHRGLPQVLWFGNSSSSGNQGLAALSECMPELALAYRRRPFRLLVVSNDRPLYERLIAGRGVPSRFQPWSALGMFEAFERSRVCLIPMSHNGFNRGKSPNRLLMAMAHDLPVIASSVEAYQPFADCVALDDFNDGLIRYLSDEQQCQADLRAFRRNHWAAYQPAVLAGRWVQRLGL